MSAAPALIDTPEITQYKTLETIIAEHEARNEKIFYDIATPAGEKEARSIRFKLQTVAGDVERARKAAKSVALEFGRKVDAQAAAMEARVRALIEVHDAKIRAKEAKEQARRSALQLKVDTIAAYGADCTANILTGQVTSADLCKAIDALTGHAVTAEEYADFAPSAEEAKKAALLRLAELLNLATAEEKKRADAAAKDAELEALRREKEARDRQQAQEDARRAAEAQAAADTAAAEKRAQEAEQARLEAIRKAEQAAKDAEIAALHAKVKAAEDAEAARVKAEAEKAAAVAAAAEEARLAGIRAAEKAEKDRLAAEQAAKDAETARLAAIAKAEADRVEAARKAEADKQAAIEAERAAAKAEADRVEARRQADELNAQIQREAKERDAANRKKITWEIVEAINKVEFFEQYPMDEEIRLHIAEAIVAGKIPHVTVNF